MSKKKPTFALSPEDLELCLIPEGLQDMFRRAYVRQGEAEKQIRIQARIIRYSVADLRQVLAKRGAGGSGEYDSLIAGFVTGYKRRLGEMLVARIALSDELAQKRAGALGFYQRSECRRLKKLFGEIGMTQEVDLVIG